MQGFKSPDFIKPWFKNLEKSGPDIKIQEDQEAYEAGITIQATKFNLKLTHSLIFTFSASTTFVQGLLHT